MSAVSAPSVLDLRHPAPAGPSSTRLRLPDLLRITDEGADDALHGRFDHLLPDAGLPADDQWAALLHAEDELEVWLHSWVPDQATELHDHCGSLGAMTVISGSLREYRWDGRKLVLRKLDAGDQAGFPLGWVHDVMRAPDIRVSPASDQPAAISTAPTLSVHAYSPPLTAMSYYEVTQAGKLRRTHTSLTAEPQGTPA